MHIFPLIAQYQSTFNFLLRLFAFVLASFRLGPNIPQSNWCLLILDLDFLSQMSAWTYLATLVAVHFTPDLISSLGHQFLDATITLLPPCIRTTFLACVQYWRCIFFSLHRLHILQTCHNRTEATTYYFQFSQASPILNLHAQFSCKPPRTVSILFCSRSYIVFGALVSKFLNP